MNPESTLANIELRVDEIDPRATRVTEVLKVYT